MSAFAWLFLLLLLQNLLHFIFPQIPFPFLLIGLIFYALSEGPFFGLILGCYAGFFLDLFGLGRIGPQIMLFGALGMFAGWSASTLFRDSWPTQVLFPAAANLVLLFLDRLIRQSTFSEEGMTTGFFPGWAEWQSVALAALLSPFIFRFLGSVSFASRQRSLKWR